ncbi:MAG: hypothetical protein BWY02_02979 [bacterium ADurb.Bin157]|nr:MAG: hypothetical protein BWY02_02979 [bacterium ADurb.Bin157]
MKLSELSFKVITGTEERNRAIQEALFAKGGVWCNDEKEVKNLDAVQLSYNAKLKTDRVECRLDGLQYSGMRFSPKHFFNEVIAPEVTFHQALDLIAQVDDPQPEFSFKPFDKIIAAYDGYSSTNWVPEFFSLLIRGSFWTMNRMQAPIMIAKYEGNENLLGESIMRKPAEWWEIKDGKPVLVKRDK